MREIAEEAGVRARIVGPLGTVSLGPGVLVDYFLLEALEERPSPEGRSVRWCSADEARALLRYPEARGLLDDAERLAREG
jgi:8-oxo-dGTP pyrophosphatase MutT (NUDIX family)